MLQLCSAKNINNNEAIYREATKTLLHSFYPDDFIKLVETEKTAIRLVKQLVALT